MSSTDMTKTEDGEIISTGSEQIELIEEFVVRSIKQNSRVQKNLNTLSLFRDKLNNKGDVVKHKAQTTARSTVLEQVLLEERDKYEEADRHCQKYTTILDSFLTSDGFVGRLDENTDIKDVLMIMKHLESAKVVRARHLESLQKCATNQVLNADKHAVSMSKIMLDARKMAQSEKFNKEKFDLLWAQVERTTGKSREDLLKELYED